MMPRRHRLALLALAATIAAAPCGAGAQTAPPAATPATAPKAAPHAASRPTGATTHAGGTTHSTTAASGTRPQTVEQLAETARIMEEAEAWSRAAETMRQLRSRIALDGDLELMLAWCDARGGRLDSAAAILDGPVLARAGDDSLPAMRQVEYPWSHAGAWLNGRFDGWHWYIWRTRAELAAARGRWADALAAARRATAARPLVGKEWHIQALCAARLGDWEHARAWESQAIALDPMLPEAYYVRGIIDWHDGMRNDAQQRFRQAIRLDSTYREPAIAMMRIRLPGAAPDSLPAELLTGVRRVGLLTSPDVPKKEVFIQMQASASFISKVDAAGVEPNGPPPGTHPPTLAVTMLIGPNGRVVLNDLAGYYPEEISSERVSAVLATLPQWRFVPALRNGQPHPSWAAFEFAMKP